MPTSDPPIPYESILEIVVDILEEDVRALRVLCGEAENHRFSGHQVIRIAEPMLRSAVDCLDHLRQRLYDSRPTEDK